MAKAPIARRRLDRWRRRKAFRAGSEYVPASCGTPHLLGSCPEAFLRHHLSRRRRAIGAMATGISGDLPIVLLRISDAEHLDVAQQLLHAHEYLRMKQFAFDLVILNERSSSYVQDLQIGLETLVRQSRSLPQFGVEGPPGRVFVLRADLISAETCAFLASVARAVFVGARGRLSDQLDRVPDRRIPADHLRSGAALASQPKAAPSLPNLEFFNGLGGFAEDGREYVTILGPGQSTPAPWINVVANPAFGFQVATEGGGTTWSVNSRENQLTPWSNDPVTDRPGRGVLCARRRHWRLCGARRPCPSATRLAPMSPATAGDTAGSSIRRTGLRSISCNSCRSTIRSRSRVSSYTTRRAAPGTYR